MPASTLVPYTTLFRSQDGARSGQQQAAWKSEPLLARPHESARRLAGRERHAARGEPQRVQTARALVRPGDRKSTRLNSSHITISYAVFCLKKKNHLLN